MNDNFRNFAGQVFSSTPRMWGPRPVAVSNRPVDSLEPANAGSDPELIEYNRELNARFRHAKPIYMLPPGSGLIDETNCDPYGGPSYPGPLPVNGASCASGYDRSITPESLLADGCVNPQDYICDKQRGLPPWTSDSPACHMQRLIDDFTQVGTVGQTRAAIEMMFAAGGFGDVRMPGVLAGANSVATFLIGVIQPSVGVRVDWGVQLLNYAPFDLNFTTSGFVASSFGLAPAANAINADRTFSARVSQVPGGSFFVPWGVRVAPGMSVAQQIVAVSDEAVSATVSVTGLPAALAASFSMQVTLLTAFHPLTAQFAAVSGIYAGGR
jgi:hypothetical protein